VGLELALEFRSASASELVSESSVPLLPLLLLLLLLLHVAVDSGEDGQDFPSNKLGVVITAAAAAAAAVVMVVVVVDDRRSFADPNELMRCRLWLEITPIWLLVLPPSLALALALARSQAACTASPVLGLVLLFRADRVASDTPPSFTFIVQYGLNGMAGEDGDAGVRVLSKFLTEIPLQL